MSARRYHKRTRKDYSEDPRARPLPRGGGTELPRTIGTPSFPSSGCRALRRTARQPWRRRTSIHEGVSSGESRCITQMMSIHCSPSLFLDFRSALQESPCSRGPKLHHSCTGGVLLNPQQIGKTVMCASSSSLLRTVKPYVSSIQLTTPTNTRPAGAPTGHDRFHV